MKNRRNDIGTDTNDTDNIDPEHLPAGWKIDEDSGEIYDEDTGEVMGNIDDIEKPQVTGNE